MMDKDKVTGGPVHVMEIRDIHGEKEFFNKYDVIDSILLQPEVKDRKIVIMSIIGEYRKGKSFLLDYCLRYMHANYASVSKMSKPAHSENWLGDGNKPLKGFSWKHGYIADTKGILFWPDVFLHDTELGEKIAIIIMDTQGLFEIGSTQEENARIFGLSTLISSIQIINVKCIINEGLIEYLETATSLTKVIAQKQVNSKSKWKAFQNLLFLIRDWSYDGIGYSGGATYLKEFLNTENRRDTKAQAIRKTICDSFDSLDCFLLNSPGSVVTSSDFHGEWSRLEEDFVVNLKTLVESILSPRNLKVKSFLGKEVNASEFRDLLFTYFDIFRDTKIPEIENIFQMTVDNQMKAIVTEQLKAYQTAMNKDIDLDRRDFESWIQTKHESCKNETISRFFAADKLSDDTIDEKYKKILEDDIETSFKSWSNLVSSKYRAFESAKKEIMELGTENANYIEKVNQLNSEYQSQVHEDAKHQQECEERVKKEIEREELLRRQLVALEQTTKEREEEIIKMQKEEQELVRKYEKELKKQEEEHRQSMLQLEAELNKEKQKSTTSSPLQHIERHNVIAFASRIRGKNDTRKDSQPTKLSSLMTLGFDNKQDNTKLLRNDERKDHSNFDSNSERVVERKKINGGFKNGIPESQTEITLQQDKVTLFENENRENFQELSVENNQEKVTIISCEFISHKEADKDCYLSHDNQLESESNLQSNFKNTYYNQSSCNMDSVNPVVTTDTLSMFKNPIEQDTNVQECIESKKRATLQESHQDNFRTQTNARIETSHTIVDSADKQWINKFERSDLRTNELDEELRLQREKHERQMEILRQKLQQIREDPMNDYETNTKIRECSQDQTTKCSLSEEKAGNKIEKERRSLTAEIEGDKFGNKSEKDNQTPFKDQSTEVNQCNENPVNKNNLEGYYLSTLDEKKNEKQSNKADRQTPALAEETLEEQLDRQFKDAQLAYELINVLERKMTNFDDALKQCQNYLTIYLRNEFKKVNKLRDQLTALQIYDPEIQEKHAKCLEKVQKWIGDKCKKFPDMGGKSPQNEQPFFNETSPQSHLEIPNDFKEICIKYDVVVNMLLQPEVRDRRIVVISVDDNSFILDYCLSFMYKNYTSAAGLSHPIRTLSQLLEENKPLNGILFWPDVFLNDELRGEKIAIILMNTLAFSKFSATQDKNGKLFDLSTLISSILVINQQEMNKEEKKVISKKLENYKEEKKSIWPFCTSFRRGSKNDNDRIENGCSAIYYINIIGSSINCILRHLSEKTEWKCSEGNLFQSLEWLFDNILKPSNLVKKSFFDRMLTCAEYCSITRAYFKAFQEIEDFKIDKINQLMINKFFDPIIGEQLNIYQSQMRNDVDYDCKNFEERINESHLRIKAEAIASFLNAGKAAGNENIPLFRKTFEDEIEISFKCLEKSFLSMYEWKQVEWLNDEEITGLEIVKNEKCALKKSEFSSQKITHTERLPYTKKSSTSSNIVEYGGTQYGQSSAHTSAEGNINDKKSTKNTPGRSILQGKSVSINESLAVKKAPSTLITNHYKIEMSKFGTGYATQRIQPSAREIPQNELSSGRPQHKKLAKPQKTQFFEHPVINKMFGKRNNNQS